MNLPSGKEIILYYWWVTLTIFGMFLMYLSCAKTIKFTQSAYLFALGLGTSLIGLSYWASMYIDERGYYNFSFGIARVIIFIIGALFTLVSLFFIFKDIFFV